MNIDLPKIYKNIFDDEYFNFIKNYLSEYKFPKNKNVDFYGSHRLLSFDGDKVLIEAHDKVTEYARDLFGNKDILPSYATYIRYFGHASQLKEHLDEGPSSFLLDVCLSYKTQWPIIVDNKEFSLEPNEGLAFYATKQPHYRPEFPDPEDNIVEILMFGFVEPDHIWWKINEKHRTNMIKRFLNQSPQNKNSVLE